MNRVELFKLPARGFTLSGQMQNKMCHISPRRA